MVTFTSNGLVGLGVGAGETDAAAADGDVVAAGGALALDSTTGLAAGLGAGGGAATRATLCADWYTFTSNFCLWYSTTTASSRISATV
jgi:hypothetical protein